MPETRLLELLLFTACWAMVSGAASQAADDEWRFVRRDQGVEISRRPFNGSNIPELCGHTRFHASIDDVYRVISDYDHFFRFYSDGQ